MLTENLINFEMSPPPNVRSKRNFKKSTFARLLGVSSKSKRTRKQHSESAASTLATSLPMNNTILFELHEPAETTIESNETSLEVSEEILMKIDDNKPRIRPAELGFEWKQEETINRSLFCCICIQPLQDPVMHSVCLTMVCKGCGEKNENKCPVCRQSCVFTPTIPKVIPSMIADLIVSCKTCGQEMKREKIENHWKTECEYLCLNMGCFQKIQGSQQEAQHLSECAQQQHQCTMAQFGCDWTGTSSALETHQANCPLVKFDKSFKRLEKSTDVLRRKYPMLPAVGFSYDPTVHASPIQTFAKQGAKVDFLNFENVTAGRTTGWMSATIVTEASASGPGILMLDHIPNVPILFTLYSDRIRPSSLLSEQQIRKDLLKLNATVDCRNVSDRRFYRGRITKIEENRIHLTGVVDHWNEWFVAPYIGKLFPKGTRYLVD